MGGKGSCTDPRSVSDLGITHIVNATVSEPCYFAENIQHPMSPEPKPTSGVRAVLPIAYLRLAVVDDVGETRLPEALAVAMEFIAKALADPCARVLIHCNQGRSRSSAVAIAWLMKSSGMSYDAALDMVRHRRHSLVQPNPTFESVLRQLQGP
mmetsp:Transcript_58197/g.127600  ORF Transcript_58197/g.127600 Transcript_58197/m.127600 type:complete len:153 (+) Transcript_58197:50-508(+)